MKRITRSLSFAGLLLAGTASLACADKALVVGVNEYPSLAQGSNLEGCVNDAHNVEKSLSNLGFSVSTVVNEQASKKAILEALAKIKLEAHPDERFVFYFAGHGVVATDGASALLPADASEKSENSDLSRDELYNAIMAVPARSRTVVLDSCFSGGLSRKGLGHKVKRARFYSRASANPGRRARDLEGGDSNDHIAGGAEIVYFTASLANQTSGEDDFEGVRGGVFTHFFSARLEKATKQTLWNEVQKDVTGEVADYMEQTQTPKLSPADYAAHPIFEGKNPPPDPKPDPKPEPSPEPKRTVWDDFNEDHTDTSAFALKMLPGQNSVKVKQIFSFEAKIGAQGGWLILLEKDTDGKVYLLLPGDHNLDAARVGANSTVRLPIAAGRSDPWGALDDH